MVTKRDADKAYEQGQPLMTDEEYDRTFGKNATAEYLNGDSAWDKMPHPDRFGGSSLDKISVIVNGEFSFSELHDWARKYSPPYCCSYKYDGISVNLIYVNEGLEHAVTKGAGNLGEDILRNVAKMKNYQPSIQSFDGCIKAEIIIDQQTFDEHLTGRYVNARNGAAGAARAFDGANAHHCSLKYYGVVPSEHDLYNLETEKFRDLEHFGFEDVVWFLAWDVDGVIRFYNETLEKRSELGYEIDGIVVTTQLISAQESRTNGSDERPRYSMAIKLPYSEKKSTIRDIVWQNGMKGRITPVAIIDPIELSGAMVNRVTLKNLDEMERLQIGIDDEVLVSRRGDVIPNIESNLSKRSEKCFVMIPANCPACGKLVSVERPYVFCRNPECSSKALGDIKTWVNTMKDHFNYRGFADKRIEQLHEEDLVRNPVDLYLLEYELLVDIPGIGHAVAEDILGITDFVEIPFSVFLTALNIEGINHKMAKLVSEKYGTFEKLIDVWMGRDPYSSLQSIPGFGDFRALALVQGLESKRETWRGLYDYVKIVPDKKPKGNVLNGKKICITGTLSQSRDYFANLIEENGGKVASGISNATDYLLAGEKVGAGKTNAAKECGTKVITEQEFMDML